MEYLVTMTTHVPDGTPDEAVNDVRAREAAHTRELAEQGHMIRLRILPAEHGVSSSLGLYRAGGGAEMQAILESLPLYRYLTTRTTQLAPHPSDPAAPGSRAATGQERIGADNG
jgi:muconolactone delta-isomerase